MTVTIGVVGCGKIAEKHFSAYQKLDNVEIVATDVDESMAAKVTRMGFEWADDPHALIDGDRVDAIDVCTPVSTHADIILRALATDKDVFCEKPLATSVEDVEAIYEATRETENTLMVGYLYRYHPAFEFARDALFNEIIGDPYYAIFRVGGRGSASTWKHRASDGGGAGNEMLVHMLDLITWFFGDFDLVDTLHSDVLLEEREIDGEQVTATAEDVMLLQLQAGRDVEVICQSDLVTPSYMNYVEIQGTNGTIWTTILDYFPTFVYCKEPRGIFDRGHNFREFDRVDLFERELGHFVDCVTSETDLPWDAAADSLRIRNVLDEARTP